MYDFGLRESQLDLFGRGVREKQQSQHVIYHVERETLLGLVHTACLYVFAIDRVKINKSSFTIGQPSEFGRDARPS